MRAVGSELAPHIPSPLWGRRWPKYVGCAKLAAASEGTPECLKQPQDGVPAIASQPRHTHPFEASTGCNHSKYRSVLESC